jgi:hypothetical protein
MNPVHAVMHCLSKNNENTHLKMVEDQDTAYFNKIH